MASTSSQIVSRVVFVVVACAALARSIPLPEKPGPGAGEPEVNANYPSLHHDFYAMEKKGYYTGPWTPGTVTTFNRTWAALRKCPFQNPAFEEFLDKYTGQSKPGCATDFAMVRDFRSHKQTQLTGAELLNFEIYSHEMFPETSTYEVNVDRVWQVTVPSSYTVHINLSFWFDDLSDGECGDYVALYADADPPEVMCSKGVTTTTIVKQGIEKLTVKFHSNIANANGGFKGNVFMALDAPSISVS